MRWCPTYCRSGTNLQSSFSFLSLVLSTLSHRRFHFSPPKLFENAVVRQVRFLSLGPGFRFPLRQRRRLGFRLLLLFRRSNAPHDQKHVCLLALFSNCHAASSCSSDSPSWTLGNLSRDPNRGRSFRTVRGASQARRSDALRPSSLPLAFRQGRKRQKSPRKQVSSYIYGVPCFSTEAHDGAPRELRRFFPTIQSAAQGSWRRKSSLVWHPGESFFALP